MKLSLKKRIIVGDTRIASIREAVNMHIPEPCSKRSLTTGTRRKIPTNPYMTVGIPVIISTTFLIIRLNGRGPSTLIMEAHPRLIGNAIAVPRNEIDNVPQIIG